MQRSFSNESAEPPTRSKAQLEHIAKAIKHDIYRTHPRWEASGDQKTLMRQQQLSIALERTLHRLKTATGSWRP